MIVELLRYTEDADGLCGATARSCYSERSTHKIMDDGDNLGHTLRKTLESGHTSVIEHATYTFSIEGISRVTTHQIVRHRVASYTQQSMRYVDTIGKTGFVIPPSVEGNPFTSSIYKEYVERSEDMYDMLCRSGIPEEDARYLIPMGIKSNITVTMNARELLHFFALRCCNRSQWEIRDLANKMLELCKEVTPIIFEKAGAPCVFGHCPEGAMSCNKGLSNDTGDGS